jgi:hypothetical protein
VTNEEIQLKWAEFDRQLKLTADDFTGDREPCRMGLPRAIAKCRLRLVVANLKLLDYWGEQYEPPFTPNQFAWTLTEPVGQKKRAVIEGWLEETAAWAAKYRSAGG